jgi:hypothetical protein
MLSAVDHDSAVRLAQVVGSCVAFVVLVRLRPWRWVLPWVRRG